MVRDKKDWTTISIDLWVKNKLRVIGKMGETYNDVVKRLLKGVLNE